MLHGDNTLSYMAALIIGQAAVKRVFVCVNTK